MLRKVWNPFYDILDRLKTYRLDKEESPISIVTKTKEFIQLQDASNALIRHAKEAYTSQKQFAENASHELQTPIAIIINKLELLLESENLKEDDANTIAQVINIADRLKKLNNSLLLLVKIETKQFLDPKRVSINEITKELLSNYQEFADFKSIEFNVVETDDLYVQMNTSLAEILISNLVKNAIFHNKNDGEISIRISKHKFTIGNTGSATALDAKTIFNRFEKDHSKSQSTGLGLAVCSAICSSYDINITYQFENSEHHFIVDFKNCTS